jgi:hypothetical protein
MSFMNWLLPPLGIKSLVSIRKEAAWIPKLVWTLGFKEKSLHF